MSKSKKYKFKVEQNITMVQLFSINLQYKLFKIATNVKNACFPCRISIEYLNQFTGLSVYWNVGSTRKTSRKRRWDVEGLFNIPTSISRSLPRASNIPTWVSIPFRFPPLHRPLHPNIYRSVDWSVDWW